MPGNGTPARAALPPLYGFLVDNFKASLGLAARPHVKDSDIAAALFKVYPLFRS